jgi:hypothetical protein
VTNSTKSKTQLDEESKTRTNLQSSGLYLVQNHKLKHGVMPIPITIDINTTDNSSLMTETLARVYLEQKKMYQKSNSSYEIHPLKYPEKK